MKEFVAAVDQIGFAGPFILAFMGAVQLWERPIYFYAFLIALVSDSALNHILKTTIQQPRPVGYHNHNDGGYYSSGAHVYGMPSAHSQTSFFILSYLWFVLGSIWWTIVGLFIAMTTLYQRWKYRKHSIEQLVVGAVVGGLFGWVSYYIVTRNMVALRSAYDL